MRQLESVLVAAQDQEAGAEFTSLGNRAETLVVEIVRHSEPAGCFQGFRVTQTDSLRYIANHDPEPIGPDVLCRERGCCLAEVIELDGMVLEAAARPVVNGQVLDCSGMAILQPAVGDTIQGDLPRRRMDAIAWAWTSRSFPAGTGQTPLSRPEPGR